MLARRVQAGDFELPAEAAAAHARERALVLAARAGDSSAYAELIRLHERIVYRTAYLIAGANDADDATQSALLKAYRALGRFRVGKPFRPWLLRIVMNEAKTMRRSAARKSEIDAKAVASYDHGVHVERDEVAPEMRLLSSERRLQIGRALDSLRQESRDVVVCRFLLELSEEETAGVLGIPVGTVKSRLSRALDQLRVELEPDNPPVREGTHAAEPK